MISFFSYRVNMTVKRSTSYLPSDSRIIDKTEKKVYLNSLYVSVFLKKGWVYCIQKTMQSNLLKMTAETKKKKESDCVDNLF